MRVVTVKFIPQILPLQFLEVMHVTEVYRPFVIVSGHEAEG